MDKDFKQNISVFWTWTADVNFEYFLSEIIRIKVEIALLKN